MTFDQSPLWRTAFSAKPSVKNNASEKFKVAYDALREKVRQLTNLIVKDMPDYTVHDITHLDALWDIGSEIAGPQYSLNPAEAFVLGGAILLHDAAMTMAAYPGGLQQLKETTEWSDTMAQLSRAESSKSESELEKYAIVEVLRLLHAKQAQKLPTQAWKSANGEVFYLIDDVALRSLYGDTIGRIARSHWLGVNELENEFPAKLGALPSTPLEWTVDCLKLACILRVADASHVDAQRAPHFLRALLKPAGVSDDHWLFQGRLARPSVDNEVLILSSGGAFPEGEANAWWLCYDAANMIDRELSEVDALLSSSGRRRFQARSVAGASNPRVFKKFVPTDGWEPVDTRLHVSDVPQLVEVLGGKALYGDQAAIPLRELLQNAADAVRARRALSGPAYSGKINVRLFEREAAYILEVEDDGVGMSEFTLVNVLLDFGKSLWRSAAVNEEFPGLASAGMKARGKFGIGFFSVFMLGDRVRVFTRRYERGVDAELTLEFMKGARARPILRRSVPPGYVENGGTCISIQLNKQPTGEGGVLKIRGVYSQISLETLVAYLCPCLDVRVDFSEGERSGAVLDANDWKNISGAALLARITGNPQLSNWQQGIGKAIRIIKEKSGEIVGRATLLDDFMERHGVLVEDGLRVGSVPNIAGVMFGSVTNAARTEGRTVASVAARRGWASNQSKVLGRLRDLSDTHKFDCAGLINSLGGSLGDLPVIRHRGKYLSRSAFAKSLKRLKEVSLISDHDVRHTDEDDCGALAFESLALGPSIVVRPEKMARQVIEEVIRAVWLYGYSTEEDDLICIGLADHTEIYRDGYTYKRNPAPRPKVRKK